MGLLMLERIIPPLTSGRTMILKLLLPERMNEVALEIVWCVLEE